MYKHKAELLDKTLEAMEEGFNTTQERIDKLTVELEAYKKIGTVEELKALEVTKKMIEKSNFCIEQYRADTDTAYQCGYNKAIDDVVERLSLEISESIIWDMLATMSENGSLSDTSDKIVDYIIDTSKKIAEQLKGGSDDR